jgi:hypothetical protein
MSPRAFLTKWRRGEGRERSASQSLFNGLCALLGVLDPVTAGDIDALIAAARRHWSHIGSPPTSPPPTPPTTPVRRRSRRRRRGSTG